jgi:hypothetical protein
MYISLSTNQGDTWKPRKIENPSSLYIWLTDSTTSTIRWHSMVRLLNIEEWHHYGEKWRKFFSLVNSRFFKSTRITWIGLTSLDSNFVRNIPQFAGISELVIKNSMQSTATKGKKNLINLMSCRTCHRDSSIYWHIFVTMIISISKTIIG